MNEEISENVLKGRAAVYECLFRAFYRVPDENFLKLTENFKDIALSLAAESDSVLMKEGATMIDAFILSEFFADKDVLLSLNAVYTKLFVSAKRANDRESRRRDSGKNCNEIILSVSGYFADSKVVKPSVINMPIDSFAMELFYMFKTAYPFDKRQAVFLEDHLGKWQGEYLQETAEAAGNNDCGMFYGGLAKFCSGFLEDDNIWLKQFIER